MDNELNGSAGIVTGAASGIGKALATELYHKGAHVYIVDVDEKGLKSFQGEMSGTGHLYPVTMDVSDVEAWRTLVQRIKEAQGTLDFVINNAGISIDGEMKDMSIPLWDKIIAINLKGVIYGTQIAYEAMIPQKKGHIVNISSLSGLIPGWMQVAYSTTKWAVLGFTRSLRVEAIAYGIKVTAVCPGIVDTSIFDNTTLLDISRKDFKNQVPFKPMNVTRSAQLIIREMLKNKAEVVFPFHAKALKYFYKLLPGTFESFGKKDVVKFRKLIGNNTPVSH